MHTFKQEIYTAIDHIYDLHHNGGSVLTRAEGYNKYDDVTIEWLQQALMFKAEIKNIHMILPRVSNDLRKIALAALKIAGVKPPTEQEEI